MYISWRIISFLYKAMFKYNFFGAFLIVTCGNHPTETCNLCVHGNDSGSCNGDCYWNTLDSTCVIKGKLAFRCKWFYIYHLAWCIKLISRSNNNYVFLLLIILESNLEGGRCNFVQGDGKSRREKRIIGWYGTAEECEDAVKREKPNANGATWGVSGSKFGKCYAEFQHKGKFKNSKKWKTCKFFEL